MANWIGNLYQQLLDTLDDSFDVRVTNIELLAVFFLLNQKKKILISILIICNDLKQQHFYFVFLIKSLDCRYWKNHANDYDI